MKQTISNFLDVSRVEVGRRGELIMLGVLLALLAVVTFVCPLVAMSTGTPIINNQFLIGPAVNAALIIGAITLRGLWKVLPVVFMPSVAAISLNLFFAVGNNFMLFMIPAIWAGNLALVLVFKYFFVKMKANFIVVSFIGVAAKVGIIFLTYYVLLSTSVIPQGSPVATAMWSMMGLNQAITATVGCLIAFGTVKLIQTRQTKLAQNT